MPSMRGATICSASSSIAPGAITLLVRSWDRDSDLADVCTGAHHRHGLFEPLPVEDVADVRSDGCPGYHIAHLAVGTHAADSDPDDAKVVDHHLGDGDRCHIETAEHTDYRDSATHAGRVQRLRQGSGPTDVDDQVGAPYGGQLLDLVLPGGRVAVVDEMCCTQTRSDLEFVVRGRCQDHSGTQRAGQLHGEQRHPAGPLGNHDVALADAGFLHRASSRHRGTRNRGGFDIAEMVRRGHQAGDIGHAVLLQPTVFAVPGQLPLYFRRRRPVQPTWLERPHYSRADLQAVDVGADFHDHAGAITHRDARPGPGEQAHQIDVVVIVEARRIPLAQPLAGAGVAYRPFDRTHRHAGPVHHDGFTDVRNTHAAPAF